VLEFSALSKEVSLKVGFEIVFVFLEGIILGIQCKGRETQQGKPPQGSAIKEATIKSNLCSIPWDFWK
jgi:hypothetical protein